MRKLLMIICGLFLMGITFVDAQTRVQGAVFDEAGEPLIGATVQIKGALHGTVTDREGRFTLLAPSNGVLVISYIGMKSQEVSVKPNLKIVLQSDVKELDEVIAVAYGTTKRSSFTGSAATVNSNAIEKRPITNITSVLEGNASGVQTTSALGQPGSSSSLRIRGFGSVNASNAPLYVVDGAIYNGALADINPNDIESLTVLKDAASTALYGSSAGNGVILITTKRGKDGAGVTLNMTQGGSVRAYKDYDRVNIWEYYPL